MLYSSSLSNSLIESSRLDLVKPSVGATLPPPSVWEVAALKKDGTILLSTGPRQETKKAVTA